MYKATHLLQFRMKALVLISFFLIFADVTLSFSKTCGEDSDCKFVDRALLMYVKVIMAKFVRSWMMVYGYVNLVRIMIL
jgi:hypothetical protein